MTTITYVGGCGRLGLALSAWSAECGYEVYATDINREMVDAVNRGKVDTMEPMVSELVAKHTGKNLKASTDTPYCAARSEMIFVVVPTPSGRDGSFSIESVLKACGDVGDGLTVRGGGIVVVVSTVNPGDMRHRIGPALQRATSVDAWERSSLYYSPEFIRQGSIVRDFANPDLILIGCTGDAENIGVSVALLEYCDRIVERDSPIHVMSAPSAEIAKLGLNAALGTKMAMANQLGWLCHYTPGADAQDVADAIGADPRIGDKYFMPGLPPGGPCLPRDSAALAHACQERGLVQSLAESVDKYARTQYIQLAVLVAGLLPERKGRVGVMGLTYKTGTDIVEESAGTQLLAELSDMGIVAKFYDPVARGGYDLGRLVRTSDVLVITTPWPEFKVLEEMDLSGKVVLDCWGLLDESELNCDRYIRLGKGI
jgi:UDPglucose 6-dehydrogenase